MYWNGFNYSVFLIRMIDLGITKSLRMIKPAVSAAAGTRNVCFILGSSFSVFEVTEATTDMAETIKAPLKSMLFLSPYNIF